MILGYGQRLGRLHFELELAAASDAVGIDVVTARWSRYDEACDHTDAATVALIGPIVVPMGIMTGVAGEPWAIGMAVALASSYAHFLIVGSPANALTFALGIYPDTNKRALEAVDFVKYGFGFFILSMLLLWIIGFLVIYPIVGFPEGILEQATKVLETAK